MPLGAGRRGRRLLSCLDKACPEGMGCTFIDFDFENGDEIYACRKLKTCPEEGCTSGMECNDVSNIDNTVSSECLCPDGEQA